MSMSYVLSKIMSIGTGILFIVSNVYFFLHLSLILIPPITSKSGQIHQSINVDLFYIYMCTFAWFVVLDVTEASY